MTEAIGAAEIRDRTLRALIHAARNPLAALVVRMELAEEGHPLDGESLLEMRAAAGRVESALRVLGMVLSEQGDEAWGDFVDVWTRVAHQLWPSVRIEVPSLEPGWVLCDAPTVGRQILSFIRDNALEGTRAKVSLGIDPAAGLLFLRCETADSGGPVTAALSVQLEPA